MSGGQICKCGEAKEPIRPPAGSNRPGRLWRVVAYKCNYSAFNGYHHTSSDYSACMCLRCGAHWRTKASYPGLLDSLDMKDRDVSRGYPAHRATMAAWGREPLS